MNRHIAHALTALALGICSTPSADAVGLSIARSAGMAGAYMGMASGVEASRYNPANLGLTSHQRTGLLLAGAGVTFANNSFSLADYNKYSGAILTQADKDYILGKIPVEGLIVSADAEASVAGVANGSIALAFTGQAGAEMNLGHTVLDLLLNGNAYGDTLKLQSMYGSAIAYGGVGVSYGFPVLALGNRQLAFGVTAKYLKGFYYNDIVRLTGDAVTLTTGFAGDGSIILNTAQGGTGYGLDFGAALKLSEHYTAGISLYNAVSRIRWDYKPKEEGFLYSFDSLYVGSVADSLSVTQNYTRTINPFVTSLPRVLRTGIANTTGRLQWAFDWTQGFTLAPGSSTKPRVALGAEWRLIPLVPLRAGYALGGSQGAQLAGGAGLDLGPLYFDFAALSASGTGSGARGLQLAVSSGLNF